MIVACFGSLLGLAASGAEQRIAVAICGYAIGLMILRTSRMIWIIRSYLAMTDLDSLDRSGGLPVRDDLSR
jgi:hypothetical protein